MTGRHGRGPKRLPILVVVAGLLALAGVANATMRAPQYRSGQRVLHPSSMVFSSSRVTSSAWYCAGPLPLGKGAFASSIAVANLGHHAVSGQLEVATTAAGASKTAISVPASTQSVFGLIHTGAASSGAVTVLVDSAAVGVDEVVHGPTGPIVAPCVEHAATTQYLAPGSTEGADNLSLALYDPGATPSVVSVSFATSTGESTPPPFQGVAVAAGHVVVLSVGHEVPTRELVGTTVHATGGSIVAGALVLDRDDRANIGSLIASSPTSTKSLSFPAAPISTGAHQSFSVLNPSSRPARVQLQLDGSTVHGELSELVPPGAITALVPSALSSQVSVSAASVTSSVPVVVGRELVVASAIAASRRGTGVSAHLFESLPPGFAVSSGVAAPARRWLLGAGESYGKVAELVVVSNHASTATTVRLSTLSTGASGSQGLADLASVEVPANATVPISLAGLRPSGGALPVVVQASGPVVAGDVLYARGDHAMGFTTVPGIPIAG